MNTIISAGISGVFEPLFDKMWWGISRGFLGIINMLEQAFRFVVGAGELVDENGIPLSSGGGDTLSYMFKRLFASEEGAFKNLYWQMVVLFVSLMAIFVIIGVIRAQFTKEPMASIKKMVGTSFWSIFKMLLVPIFFFFALLLTAQIFSFLLNAMSHGSENSLSETMCDCFCREGGGYTLSDLQQRINFNSSYADVKDYLQADCFDFTLCILTSACLVVTIATSIIAVTKRFVKIFLYYITAPMVLSKSMLDDGKSWELWKDNLLAQLLGAGGVIIAMYLFVEMVPIATDIVNSTFRDNGQNAVAAILKIVLILGMSTVPAGATAFVGQLVSQGAGQNESNDLSHSQQMLGNGMRLAGLAAGKALSGSLSALSGGGGGISAAMRGGVGGGASALTPTSTPLSSNGGGNPLGQMPSPLGGSPSGGAGGNLGAAAMQSAAAVGLSPMGGNPGGGGGAGSTGGSFGGAPGGGTPGAGFGSGGGKSASPSPMSGPSPSLGSGGGGLQSQSSAAGAAGSALASGAGAMQRAGASAMANPEMFTGAADAAAQQVGSSAPQESFGKMFLRDQQKSDARHAGGINTAIFRGGVIGAVGYGLMRLAGRALTAGWSVAKGLGSGVKKLVGKIPVPGKGGQTLGERWAERSAARKQLKQDREMANANLKQQRENARRDRSTTQGLYNAQNRDAKQNWTRKGNEPLTNNNERHYIDKQLDAFQKERAGVEKTLGKDKYKNLSNDQKNAYRQKMLGGSMAKLQRTLGASQYGRSDAVQNRFKNILSGDQKQGGEQQ